MSEQRKPVMQFVTSPRVMAEYDPATGAVSFDWRVIEACAADPSDQHSGVAKILLAARREGEERERQRTLVSPGSCVAGEPPGVV